MQQGKYVARQVQRFDPPITDVEARHHIALTGDGWLADQINWCWDDGGHFGGPGRLLVKSIHYSKAAYDATG